MQENKIKTLIIDDDPFIRDLLQDKLMQYFPEVQVLETANSGVEGLAKIETYKPELIFLDVEMADMTGFEMLSKIGKIDFKTIFITSYSHYAIKAIRFNALDYLLKPIDLTELRKALKRYKDTIEKEPHFENIQQAIYNMNTDDVSKHKLVLKTQEGELRLIIRDIVRVEGERNYSYIYLKNGRKKLVTKTLLDMEDLLSSKGFFRTHKSFLVNIMHIISSPNRFALMLSDGHEIPISRRRKKEFQNWYEAKRKISA